MLKKNKTGKNKTGVKSLFRTLKQVGLLSFLMVLLLWFVGARAVHAHRPHDVVTQVELSPTFGQDQTLFIVARSNLFKSTNGGENWTRIVQNLDAKSDFSSLAISPQSRQTLFVATYGDGIYRSQDAGATWVKVNQGLDNLNIELLAIAPDSDALVFAAGKEQGLYKTKDAGENWVQVLADQISVIAFLPGSTTQLVAGDQRGNLYVSEDGGESWRRQATLAGAGKIMAIAAAPNFPSDQHIFIGTEKKGLLSTTNRGESFTPLTDGLSEQAIQDIVVLPQDQTQFTLYISTWNDGVFSSADNGKTWRHESQGLTTDAQADELSSPHFSDLELSNEFNQDKTMFVGGFNGFFKSTDGGRTWGELVSLSPLTLTGLAISPDYQNDSTLAAVTYVGDAYISHDKGQNWSLMHQGLEVPRLVRNFRPPNQDPRRFFDVTFSPNYPADHTLFATLLWSKVVKSSDQGKHWQIISLPKEARGLNIVTSPNFATDKTVYIAAQGGMIFQSTNGGNSFTELSAVESRSTNDAPSLVVSPNFAVDKTLYAAGAQGVYKSVDSGKTWTLTSQALKGRTNLQVAISPHYATDQTLIVGTDQGIFQTQDGGNTWVRNLSSQEVAAGYVEGVALSPHYQTDQTFLVSVRGQGLFKTVNQGTTFERVGDPAIALSRMNSVPSASIPLKFSPSYATDQTIYGFGAADATVFQSVDAGNTWRAIAIPKFAPVPYSPLTRADLWLYVYRSRLLKVCLAVISGIVSYLLLGRLGLERKLPFKRLHIETFGSVLVVVLALIALRV